jgi:hypothetical protein
MEISDASVLEIWNLFYDLLDHKVSSTKRDDLAVKYIRIFLENDIDLSEFEDLRGEDGHLDHAFDELDDPTEDEEEVEDED